MKKLAWCTDVHLDFVDSEDRQRIQEVFIEPIAAGGFDGLILTGDVSLADHVVRHLDLIDRSLGMPVYFVLGNHDFYGGSFEDVRRRVGALCVGSSNLRYMTGGGPVSLSGDVAIVGDDGWYDARHGDPHTSGFVMSDWLRITDYARAGSMRVTQRGLVPNMRTIASLSAGFADASSARLKEAMLSAARTHRTVIVLTHVPPWPHVHRHNGKTGSPMTHPWYTSRATGDAIESVAAEFPGVRFEVFCGHTHGKFDAQLGRNVFCHVGGSKYGSPGIAGVIRVE